MATFSITRSSRRAWLGGSDATRRRTPHWRDWKLKPEKENAALGFYVIRYHRGNSEETNRHLTQKRDDFESDLRENFSSKGNKEAQRARFMILPMIIQS